jgi:hypothetical protein
MLRVLLWALFNAQAIMIVAFWFKSENTILSNALIALLGLIASIIGAYVFGATWDDNDKRRHLSEREDFDPYGQTIDPPPIVAAVANVTQPLPAADPTQPPEGYAQ